MRSSNRRPRPRSGSSARRRRFATLEFRAKSRRGTSLPSASNRCWRFSTWFSTKAYASTDAPSLLRPDLVREAIRLARLSVALLPEQPEARGLLALMLLTDSRRRAASRRTASSCLSSMQDRSLWDRAEIDEGVRILDEAFAYGAPGPYQVQAAIAALHATAPTSEATDWRQISALVHHAFEIDADARRGAQRRRGVRAGDEPRRRACLDRAARNEGRSRSLSSAPRLEGRTFFVVSAVWKKPQPRCGQALALVTNPAERRYLQKRLSSCLIWSYLIRVSRVITFLSRRLRFPWAARTRTREIPNVSCWHTQCRMPARYARKAPRSRSTA